MTEKFDFGILGGEVYLNGQLRRADLGVRQGKIAAIESSISKDQCRESVRASGLTVFPGFIDSQVHFREPGWEQKEDLETGSRAALLGGVTTYFEMPNTNPPTTTAALLEDKLNRARGRSWVNYGFYVGATAENAEELQKLEATPGCIGVKVFVGSSTGNLLVESASDLERIFRSGRGRVAVHCEDQARLVERKSLIKAGTGPEFHPIWRDEISAMLATQRIVELARRFGRRVHILHVSTAEEVEFLRNTKAQLTAIQDRLDLVTCEVTPNHLLFEAPDCYRDQGTLVQMNPPIRDARHRRALWRGLTEGVFDVMGSDHAPHTLEEKSRPYPDSPSGMPGVQTIVPLMLDQVNQGSLSLQRLVSVLSEAPARIFGLKTKGRIEIGADADLTIVDMALRREIRKDWIASRCGWSPFVGRTLLGWPLGVVLGGFLSLWEGQVIGVPQGQAIRRTV